MHSDEIWKPVSGYEAYEVSSLGRVRSITRIVENKLFRWERPGATLKPFVNKRNGYLQVMLRRKKLSVHRLVAVEFCGAASPGAVVNHKNGIKTDNRAENLEWTTVAENTKHAYRVLGVPANRSRSKAVRGTHIETGVVVEFPSCSAAGRAGFRTSAVHEVCSGGRQKTHAGYRWEWALRELNALPETNP